jgi:recombination protein RecR
MIGHLPTFQKLIRQLQRVPYLASKNVYKVAHYLLKQDDNAIAQLCNTIIEAKQNIRHCERCFNFTEGAALCTFCESPKRIKTIMCVVETWHDLHAIENAGEFHGVYHILGGALSPLEGIGAHQLTIQALLHRLENENITEIIFATNPTPEGEATASYISSKINPAILIISRLASGVPIGGALEYMDRLTISKALLGRRPF